MRTLTIGWPAGRVALSVVCGVLLVLAGDVQAEVPPMPNVLPVPPSGSLPLSSATRPGNGFVDLAKAGYAEEEYYLFGAAPAITSAGEALFNVPYVTRMLVRKPKDAAKFNGTVIIEPFGWFSERGGGWILTRDYLVRKGYAYVGYTLNINKPAHDPKTSTDPALAALDSEPADLNLDFMRRFDFARYAPLGAYYQSSRFTRGGHADPFVPQAQGIGAQLARLLRSNLADGPLAGLTVNRIYVGSWAVNAQVWMDYLDQGRHQQWRMPDGRQLIDAYMTGRFDFGNVGGDIVRVPRMLPADVPFVTVYTENELVLDAIREIPMPPDTDQPMLRYYEVTGAPHLRVSDLGTEEKVEGLAADVGKENDPRCQHLYDEPVELVVSALLDRMDRWVRDGQPMPRAPRVVRKSKGVVRESATDNVIGGVRPPWMKVPAAAYMTDYETGCGIVYDTKIPYTAARLKALYGSYASYRRKFDSAIREAIGEGYLLPEDAARLSPVAQPSDFQLH